MFGCAFESTLQPEQCFIRYQVLDKSGKPLKETRFETVTGRIIVTKNPWLVSYYFYFIVDFIYLIF